MLAAIVLMVFISCFLLIYALLSCLKSDKLSILRRLENIKQSKSGTEPEEFSQPLFSRVLRPMLDSMGKAMMKVTPGELVSSLEIKIAIAGNPGNLDVKGWINIQAMLSAGLPLITLLLSIKSGIPAGLLVIVILAEVGMGFVLPGFILGKMVSARQKSIINSLPDFIDLLTISVEAGLGFDAALLKVVEKKPGPLASEFEKVLQEIKVGKQKKDALKDMARRLDIQDLTTFINATIQAEQFGIGIANVLRIQSRQMRMKRKQRAQERAMKVPVKMMIPMVVFIFPTLFIVLLGPVVIKLIEQFANY
ncbi:MAG: type II secretion system F family protein [Bacillota bacterium]